MPEEPKVTDSGSPQPETADSGATQSIGETVIQVGGQSASPQGIQADDDGRIGVLEKRIADTEFALKAKQAELTDVASRAALAKDLAETKGQLQTLLATLNEPDSEEEKQKDWIETTNWDDALTQKPGETVKDMAKRLRADMAGILEERDKTWQERLTATVAAATNPERQQLQGVLSALAAEDKDFAGLPADRQLSLARTVAKLAGGNISTPEAEAPSRAPTAPLSPGGTGISPSVPKVPVDRKARAREIARAMGFSDLSGAPKLAPVIRI